MPARQPFAVSTILLILVFVGPLNCDENEARFKLTSWCDENRSSQTFEECLQFLETWCNAGRSSSRRNSLCASVLAYIAPADGSVIGPALPPGFEEEPEKASQEQLRLLKYHASRIAVREDIHLDRIRGVDAANAFPIRDPNSDRQQSELAVNNPDDYWAGDIDLTMQQAERMATQLQADDIDTRLKKRKVGQDLYILWDQIPISYKFHPSMPSNTANMIREAVKIWEHNTCVRFKENGSGKDGLQFVNGNGCSSYVGKVGNVQQISIRTPGCDNIGIIAHEIGHALGFLHEQARPDRDNFIDINMGNVNFWYQNNFAKATPKDVNYYGLPYDYGSVMHYDAYSFATANNVPTIRTLKPAYQKTIGQRQRPSFIDFHQVNEAYCSSRCPRNQCENKGYPDPNDCSYCKCPDGFDGRLCENAETANGVCGGIRQASATVGYISSPHYPNPFPRQTKCAWNIRTEKGYKVFLKFENTFEFYCKDVCDENYVEVKIGQDKVDFRQTGSRFCCSEKPNYGFTSTEHEMVVIFKNTDKSGSGFQARYWSDAPDIRTRPPTTTTTTTTTFITTTSRRPIRTTPPIGPPRDCQCSSWVSWSHCTQDCGGCGKSSRSRQCTGFSCDDIEEVACNFTPCWGKRWLYGNGEFLYLRNYCCLSAYRRGSTCIDRKSPGTPRPTMPPRTTRRYTTQPPTTTTDRWGGGDPYCDSACSQWEYWGECSMPCGGCGRKERSRRCRNSNCFDIEKEVCNLNPCYGRSYLWHKGEFQYLRRNCCLKMQPKFGRQCTGNGLFGVLIRSSDGVEKSFKKP